MEQARSLVALAQQGTLVKAAAALHKKHTAVIYALKSLETETGLKLLDRSGYRVQITPAGKRVLEQCERLLEVEQELDTLCHELRTGWEPRLCVVVDGVFPTEVVLRVVGEMTREQLPTRVEVYVEFLSGVEEAYHEREADLMVCVVPPANTTIRSLVLPSIRAHLVAHKKHPLAKANHLLSIEDIESSVLVTVRGSDPRLEMSTAGLKVRSMVHLNDFASKKIAIMQGMGIGWLPEYMIETELEKGELVHLRWPGSSTHVFYPKLYQRRANRLLGKAAGRMRDALRDISVQGHA